MTTTNELIRVRRVQKELQTLLQDPPANVVCLPAREKARGGGGDGGGREKDLFENIDIFNLTAQISAPPDTPYQGGVFTVNVILPKRYPFEPPNVVFKTPIYHPNIDSGGRICLSTLNMPPGGTWKPSSTISSVLMSILCLIGEPNGEDGLVKDITEQYNNRREEFEFRAREMTRKFAMGADEIVENFDDHRTTRPDDPHNTTRTMDDPKCNALTGNESNKDSQCQNMRKAETPQITIRDADSLPEEPSDSKPILPPASIMKENINMQLSPHETAGRKSRLQKRKFTGTDL